MSAIDEKGFLSILRSPDYVTGATDDSPFRFEEPTNRCECPIQYSYDVTAAGAVVTIHPGSSPVKYLRLRWTGNLSSVTAAMGDEWGRIGANQAPIEWRSLMASRPLPWFCYLRSEHGMAAYGVKTGCDCFAWFHVDPHGITLFLNLMSGSRGTNVRESFTACEVTETVDKDGETPYRTAKRFMSMLCSRPVLPKEPVFGVNNWYWAYGNISHDGVMRETDYLMEMTAGTTHRPSMIIDDGWEIGRTTTPYYYNGGPFAYSNERFPDMQETAARIAAKGARPGIWYRPLLTLGNFPDEAKLRAYGHGLVMDPSHPYTLERLYRDAERLRGWGYEIIKHDFSTNDALCADPLDSRSHTVNLVGDGKSFYDNTKTTATILKNMYRMIQEGAGNADVIGCSVVGHLSAGIHSMQRVGGDTSGRSFEWTIRNGVHSFMRLPMNDTFFRMDPDCAAFTERVSSEQNLRFLELCALTGSTTLASVTPYSLTETELCEINRIYKIADEAVSRMEILDYEKTSIPERFMQPDGTEVKYDWYKEYGGSRMNISWLE